MFEENLNQNVIQTPEENAVKEIKGKLPNQLRFSGKIEPLFVISKGRWIRSLPLCSDYKNTSWFVLTLNSSVSTKERINEICLQSGAGRQCSDSPLSVCQFNSSVIGEKENLSALAIYGNKVPIALIKANKKTGGRVLFQRTKETQVTISHFFRKESDEIGEDELRIIKNKKSVYNIKAIDIKVLGYADFDSDKKYEIFIEVSNSTGGNAPGYMLISESGEVLAQ